LYDSHSRDAFGHTCEQGSAVLFNFSNLPEMLHFILATYPNQMFNLTPVSFVADQGQSSIEQHTISHSTCSRDAGFTATALPDDFASITPEPICLYSGTSESNTRLINNTIDLQTQSCLPSQF